MLGHLFRASQRVGFVLGRRMAEAVRGQPTPEQLAWAGVERAYGRVVELCREADAAAAAGRVDRARHCYAEAVPLAEGVSPPGFDPTATAARILAGFAALDALGGLAQLARAAGDPQEELVHLRRAQDIIGERAPGTAYEAVAVNRLGVALFEAGDLDEAIDAHERALAIMDVPAPLPDAGVDLPPVPPAMRALVLSSLGNAYTAAGAAEQGQRLAEEALATLPDDARGGPEEASCLSNAAAAACGSGDLRAAVARLERALVLDAGGDPRSRLASLNNLGHARLLLGDLDGARTALEDARRCLEAHPGTAGQAATVLNNLAVLELRSGHPESASPLFARAAGGSGGGRPSPQQAWAQANLAVHHLDAGRVDDAVRVASVAAETAEAVRGQRGTASGREQLSERLQAPYQALVAALHATGDPAAHARAFAVAEMSRARGLADAAATVGGPPPDAEESALRERHARARRNLRRATADPATPVAETRRLTGVERRLAWEVESHVRVRRAGPARAHVPVDAATVRATLGPRTLLLSYEINDRGLFVWSVRRDGLVMLRLGDDISAVAHHLRAARPAAGPPAPRTSPEQEAAHRALGALLLGPLPEAHIGDVERVVVVPGLLGHLAWELLPLASGQRLGDVVPVSYLPSAAAVVALGCRGRPGRAFAGDFLGVAPTHTERPLPAARREMRRVAARFARADLREGGRATVASVAADIGDYRHVHLACHGYLDDVDPLQSGFVLDPDAGGADVLHLFALVAAGLAAETVVCSGCETGLGRLREGEGMVGFGTALLAAGARFLLLNLWPVADNPTARLVTAFYDALLEGGDPVEALWRAKIRVRRSHPHVYADPMTWAGLVAVGLPDDGTAAVIPRSAGG